jgi:hypothetical protein
MIMLAIPERVPVSYTTKAFKVLDVNGLRQILFFYVFFLFCGGGGVYESCTGELDNLYVVIWEGNHNFLCVPKK